MAGDHRFWRHVLAALASPGSRDRPADFNWCALGRGCWLQDDPAALVLSGEKQMEQIDCAEQDAMGRSCPLICSNAKKTSCHLNGTNKHCDTD